MPRRKARPRRFGARVLDNLVEEAIVDAYGEAEQKTAFLTVIQERLGTPFPTTIFGIKVIVEKVDFNDGDEIVAFCRRGKGLQAIPILDLPMPSPPPAGAEWIEAYRWWAKGEGGA